MSDQDTTADETTEESVTDFAAILAQHDKGRALAEASRALAECVDAALASGKKGGSVTVKTTVEPLDNGAVRLAINVESKPVKEPAQSIWFADGDGHLSRDNAGFFLGAK
ncbi:hypothetical protein FK529_05675 [Tsukamurella asaccharolytica]|uniref:Uncharacterized protein n=1 Tax=Tsukamurella asaccharolytica TaxID=2592067 RepID=A0A5C5RDQ1_9ACTN|nr:hypothetical protein [Tsukamurella asaccharolytica]TWS20812.1 hypothetical protein FK529_05675 [Tsukamurella asaccharolytica]